MVKTSLELVPLLQRLSKSFRVMTGMHLAEIGLVSGQDQMLEVLSTKGTLSIKDLAQALNVRASTASKMVDILERQGLVFRGNDYDDARLTFVELTTLGQAKYAQVWLIWEALERELADPADANRMDILVRLDARVAKRLARMR